MWWGSNGVDTDYFTTYFLKMEWYFLRICKIGYFHLCTKCIIPATEIVEDIFDKWDTKSILIKIISYIFMYGK
mgnify:CR=1 FL=1